MVLGNTFNPIENFLVRVANWCIQADQTEIEKEDLV